MSDRKVTIEHARGEVYRGNGWVRTEIDVRVELKLSETARVILTESFATLEEAQAWRDGVLRGFDAARPLWAHFYPAKETKQ